MQGPDYLPVLRRLSGQAVYLEVGDPSRPSPEVIKGILWGVCGEAIALVIVFQDETVSRAAVTTPLPAPGQPVPVAPPPEFDTFREFYFKWIKIANILTIQSDVNVRIDIKRRVLLGTKPDPLYTDGAPEWSKLNNALVARIQAQLTAFDFGFRPWPQGMQRTDANDPVPLPPEPEPALVPAPAPAVVENTASGYLAGALTVPVAPV